MAQFKLPFPKITGWNKNGVVQLTRNFDKIEDFLRQLPVSSQQIVNTLTVGISAFPGTLYTPTLYTNYGYKGRLAKDLDPNQTAFSKHYTNIDLPSGCILRKLTGIGKTSSTKGSIILYIVRSDYTSETNSQVTEVTLARDGTLTKVDFTEILRLDLYSYHLFCYQVLDNSTSSSPAPGEWADFISASIEYSEFESYV
jgi:hypothetical protein